MIKKGISVFLFLTCLGVGLFLYALLIEPNQINIKTYTLQNKELNGLKIAFLTDLHVAPSHLKRLRKVIDLTNKQKPDIVLLGGDYINGHRAETTMSLFVMAQELSQLKAPLGTYAVLGNHDWMIDGTHVVNTFEKAGIDVLMNTNKVIQLPHQKLYIAGTEDDIYRQADIQKALENTELPRILLIHNPDLFQTLTQQVTLALAGHNHGGQISIPFWGPIVVSGKTGLKYAQGFFEENNNKLIISRGIGMSILPIRFNCRPEITLIQFN